MVGSDPQSLHRFQGLPQQRETLLGSLRTCIHGAQESGDPRRQDGEVPLAGKSQSPLEQTDREAEFPSEAIDIPESPASQNQREWMVDLLGKADPFLCMGDPFIELATLTQGQRQIATGYRGRKLGRREPLPSETAAE